MKDQPDIADALILCILLGTGMALLLIGAGIIWFCNEYKKRYNAKMEERQRLNKERFMKNAK